MGKQKGFFILKGNFTSLRIRARDSLSLENSTWILPLAATISRSEKTCSLTLVRRTPKYWIYIVLVPPMRSHPFAPCLSDNDPYRNQKTFSHLSTPQRRTSPVRSKGRILKSWCVCWLLPSLHPATSSPTKRKLSHFPTVSRHASQYYQSDTKPTVFVMYIRRPGWLPTIASRFGKDGFYSLQWY